MDGQLLKELAAIVETGRERMFAAEREIWAHPETGFREWRTSAYMQAQFEELGYKPVSAGNIPGFYCDLDTGRPGPLIALLGELDALLCPAHPESDPETGAVHACGHHAQCASLLGAAAALKNPLILSQLSGTIRFMAVPAEELIEIEYREELRKKGIIHYFGGKVEFLYRGYFDGVVAAVMLHTGGGKGKFSLSPGCNGCILKKIEFRGKAAHAGAAPHAGVNALYAANLAINAINAIRETFKDEDHIRVHPIFTTKPGAVNVIPDRATLESFVRGATPQAIEGANKRVNRAMAGAALSMGAKLTLSDRPGYMPVYNDMNLYSVAKAVMTALAGSENVKEDTVPGKGSTDMGDISCVIPALHPTGSGSKGIGHGDNYTIDDPESACILAAKFLTGTAAALLADKAAEAIRIKAESKVRYPSYKEYFKAVDAFTADIEAVKYNEDRTITVTI